MPHNTEGGRRASAGPRNFEDLLLEVSTLFISLPIDSIDEVIEDTQKKICESLGVDLSSLWQWSDRSRNLLTVTHLYTIPGGPERPAGIDASASFPWILDKILAGQTLVFSNDELPDEAEIDIRSRRYFGVESTVVIPLQAGGQPVIGCISFETLSRVRAWTDEEVKRLKLVAEVFANALVRKRTLEDLIESQERLALATESAEAGVWELDYRTNLIWTNERGRRIFGYAPDEVISIDRLQHSVYPEDWSAVERAINTSFARRVKLDVEYRITDSSGSLKWICSRGRPYFSPDGTPARMLGVSLDISGRKRLEEQQQIYLKEIEILKGKVEQENYYLREDLKKIQGFEHIVGQSKKFTSVLISARQVAPTAATVLITGETGSGKGVIAHAIHQMSDRRERPFVTVNCAALPGNLIESELFGREKGAFTGAHAQQIGRFEVANHGTIFLDEIGEMPLEMQVKLLRVLQDEEFERLGSPRTVRVDVRVIAATGRNLRDDVKTGRFREDLFYRLNVYPIAIPPLRERKDDIPILAQHFCEKYSRRMGKRIDWIPRRVLDAMMSYHWPGNVRELEHLVERGVIVSPHEGLVLNDRLIPVFPAPPDSQQIKDLAANERDHIRRVLGLTNWKIEGPGGAAEILDIHPSTLRFRLKKLDIKRPV